MPDDPRLILLHPDDDVFVLAAAVSAGEPVIIAGRPIRMMQGLALGHKVARRHIPQGGKVRKYGLSIGSASCDIAVGDHVHIHNLQSDYTPTYTLDGQHLYVKEHA